MTIIAFWKACKKTLGSEYKGTLQVYFLKLNLPFQMFECLCSPAGVSHSEMLNPPSPPWCWVISTGWINQYPTVFYSLLSWSSDQTPFKHLPLQQKAQPSSGMVPAAWLECQLPIWREHLDFHITAALLKAIFFPPKHCKRALSCIFWNTDDV